jgi:hypothetical protein
VLEQPSKLVQNEPANESDKWYLNVCLENMLVFTIIYLHKEQIDGRKNDMPRGNFLDIMLGLGLLV